MTSQITGVEFRELSRKGVPATFVTQIELDFGPKENPKFYVVRDGATGRISHTVCWHTVAKLLTDCYVDIDRRATLAVKAIRAHFEVVNTTDSE